MGKSRFTVQKIHFSFLLYTHDTSPMPNSSLFSVFCFISVVYIYMFVHLYILKKIDAWCSWFLLFFVYNVDISLVKLHHLLFCVYIYMNNHINKIAESECRGNVLLFICFVVSSFVLSHAVIHIVVVFVCD